jgi:hypothetical protein
VEGRLSGGPPTLSPGVLRGETNVAVRYFLQTATRLDVPYTGWNE